MLTSKQRQEIGNEWLERASSELGAGRDFAALAGQMRSRSVADELVALAERAVEDERRHAQLCLQLAAHYLGVAPSEPTPRAGRALVLEGDPDLLCLQHAVLTSCINETIGSAYLQATRASATEPVVRSTLRELLRDEVDHARIGWAMLAGASPSQRSAIARVLPQLLGAVCEAWARRAAQAPEQLPDGHGCLGSSEMLRVVDEAVAELVLPGFAHLGLDVAELRGR